MNDLTLVAGAATNRGPRQVNEDAYFTAARPDMGTLGTLNAVADGVGGQSEGAQASQLALKVLNEAFYHHRQSGQDVPTALRVAVQEANSAIYNAAQAHGGEAMGTTLVAAVVHQQHLFLVHIGDTRAYLMRANKLRLLTKDHSWVQEQVDAGTLTPAEAARHDLRHVVTRVMGNKPEVVPELSGPHALQAGDTILLCSDGLYDVVDTQGLQHYLSSGDAEMAALNLVQAAVTAGTGDNVTAVVLRWMDPKNAAGARAMTAKRNKRLLPIILALLAVGAIALFLRTRSGSGGGETPTIAVPTALATVVSPTVTMTPLPEATATRGTDLCGNSLYGPLCATGATSTGNETPQTPQATQSTESSRSPTLPDLTESSISLDSTIMGCVVPGQVNFWLDSQMSDGDLCEYTIEPPLVGAQVEILSDPENPRKVLGPNSGLNCTPMVFIKVRSIENPQQEGWVLFENIRILKDNEQCP